MRATSLTIHGIFERQDITFEFDKSPYFLVGPNGTGKTTALKILHNILTAQWDRLSELSFLFVDVVFDDKTELLFDKADFARFSIVDAQIGRLVRRPSRSRLPDTWDEVEALLQQSTIQLRTRRINPVAIRGLREGYEERARLINYIGANTQGKVLYFPTYRRVERDLSDLLEDNDPFEGEHPSAIAPEVADRYRTSGEIVGFGGQDIGKLLADAAARIQVAARQALNEHSVRFLETLALERPTENRKARSLVKEPEFIDYLLGRVSSFSDLNINVESIRSNINNLRAKLSKNNPGRPTQAQEMMLLYISELIELFDRIDELSTPLQEFARLITKYLKPFKTATMSQESNHITIRDVIDNEISPDQLSSGEKQVLAFFAFLLLKQGVDARYVIIDEPELSLSVSWQRDLISDILSTKPGLFVVSATHSPFIFQDFSRKNIVSLGEF